MVSFCFKNLNVFLYSSCIIANLPTFMIGCCLAWTIIAVSTTDDILQYEYSLPDYGIYLSWSQTIWLIALFPIGAVITVLFSGYFSEKRGRKQVIVIGSLILTLGFISMYFGGNINTLYFGRLVSGFGAGLILTVIPIYIAEISRDSNRGLLSTFTCIFLILGVLLMYILNLFLTLNGINFILTISAFIFLMLNDWCLTESPYWLLTQDSLKDAEASLVKLRKCSTDELSSELSVMQKNVAVSYRSRIDLKEIVSSKEIIKGLSITCGLAALQQLSGVYAIFFFVIQIIFKEFPSSFGANLFELIVTFVQLVTCIFASMLIDRFGRKILLMISTITCGSSLIGFGVYYHLKQTDACPHSLLWLAIVSIIFFSVGFALGLGPIPFVYLGEMFPSHAKSVATPISVCTGLIFAFLVNCLFGPLSMAWGAASTFWLFATFCFIGAVIIYLYIPETRRKCLQDIQELLKE